MKYSLLLILFFPLTLFSQQFKTFSIKEDRLSITMNDGTLDITPLSPKSVRVQFQRNGVREQREFVLLSKKGHPPFKVLQTSNAINLVTAKVSVTFDKSTAALSFKDKNGKVFLQETIGGRKLSESKIANEDCFLATQQFNNNASEYLFGLGQFQDGHYNLRDVPRKLVQVNTQIAIPFLYSSKGYGILWHQYGLTDFNPADLKIDLEKQLLQSSKEQQVQVTTTSGTQRVSQQESLYLGKLHISKPGTYVFMLDLGAMESRHSLVIDGVAYIDQRNLWLPPAASKRIELSAGEHTIQVICKSSNTPRLTWRPSDNLTTFRSPHAKSIDYVVFRGQNADEVISEYRTQSGTVPMLPLWAFGFWQCRERYTSGTHLVETVKAFRERNLPIDVIVQDWQYWGKYGWGVPKFDETNYPQPENFIKELHQLNTHFSISVWENLDKKSEIAKPYLDKNLYIPNSPWIDIFNPETQKVHWNVLDKNLFSLGVDSWWMDATEPENDALVGKKTYFGPGEFYRLAYPLFVSKAVYDGQRKRNPQKRVVILTRSAYPGQQRYGTINWSGDIGWDWDAYKRQIVAGLNYSLTGMPYWTTDIGGFFRPGSSQYTDSNYHEILTRWFQWGAFNPIFRIHDYQSETEPWKYGEAVENNMRTMLNLRYRLLPYLYSAAWKVSSSGSTIMRPLVMDFSGDSSAVEKPFQYMYGESILVAPVTQPGAREWEVYLPKSYGWFNFHSGSYTYGGKQVKTDAPLDQIPLFVKAGSIIPLTSPVQHTAALKSDTLEMRIYQGRNATFDLYEDQGDGYDYEHGEYTNISFKWDEKMKTFTIGKIDGTFPGALKIRTFKLIFFKPGDSPLLIRKPVMVNYYGKLISRKF